MKKTEKFIVCNKIENKKKKSYYDGVYSDDGTESDYEFSENDDESSDEEIFKKNKKTQARKGTVARTTTIELATKKEEKKQKGIADYISS